jgi:hypothetical protein
VFVLPKERNLPSCFDRNSGRKRLAIGYADGSLVIWNIPKSGAQLTAIGLD